MSDARDLTEKEQERNDHDYVRETYYDMIGKGRDAVEEMIEVCRESQHPRAYEVLAGLIEKTANIAEKMPEHHKKNHEIKRLRSPGQQGLPNSGGGNKVLVIGTTADLLKEIQREEKDITPVSDDGE